MDEKIVKLINNFKKYVESGGDWLLISGVGSEMGLILSNEPVGTFNLYKYIKDTFDVDLNVLTVDKYIKEHDLQSFDPDEAPTGYLGINIQYALVSREDGKAIVFDTIEKSLGRSSSRVDVHLAGGGISRVHCFIKLQNGKPCIKDNSSTNGVYVNGKRIGNEYTPLTPGSRVQIADSEYELMGV